MIRYTIGLPDPDRVFVMTQDELKVLMTQATTDYVLTNAPKNAMLGIDAGSTVNLFIDAMAPHKARFAGAVSSPEASTRRLQDHDFTALDLNEVDAIPVYVGGADEIDASGAMIKGGSGVLTHEKIVASVAKVFVHIIDGSKLVEMMGAFPLPAEMMPMARATVACRLAALSGQPRLCMTKEDQVYKTDSSNVIINVVGLRIAGPKGLESVVNEIPGVVTVDLFAKRGTNVLLLGIEADVQRHDF